MSTSLTQDYIESPQDYKARVLEQLSEHLTTPDFSTKTYTVEGDSEFQTFLNLPCEALVIQLSDADNKKLIYRHPKSSIPENESVFPTFQTPFALLDALNCQWRCAEPNRERPKNSLVIDYHMFWSFKDLQYLFSDGTEYKLFLLQHLERTRRIRVANRGGDTVRLPYDVYVKGKDGKMHWFALSIRIIDISAMQGSEALATYAKNANITMDTKKYYTQEQKSQMLNMLKLDPWYFAMYCLGDVGVLVPIKESTTNFYNDIAETLGVKPRKHWGYSLGKIVASITTEWLANKIGVDFVDFHKITSMAGTEGITRLASFMNNRSLLYLGMVDGGRAAKERQDLSVVRGVLVDIDIDGCYGNGLRNQKFAIGNPDCSLPPMNLRKFLEQNEFDLVPGLWYARVSWQNAPFKQDLLLSKEDKQFKNWEEYIKNFEGQDFWEGEARQYDASLMLTTDTVHQAVLQHDSLQVLRHYSSKTEWTWLLDNCIVVSSAIYRKSDRVESVEPEMLQEPSLKRGEGINWSNKWIEVNLDEMMSKLISARKTYPKKTPMNTLLKLFINAVYGTIASGYFSVKGTGVSNVVVGNNITARARVLAWCMAKGLGTFMSITDGGVFDVNKVLAYKHKSLNLFERVSTGSLKHPTKGMGRSAYAEFVPLMGKVLSTQELEQLKEVSTSSGISSVDESAWSHLSELFSKLDIFKYNQFSFESKWDVKSAITKLIIHNKVDYMFEGSNGNTKIALRGCPKIQNPDSPDEKIVDPRAMKLFEAIENNTPMVWELETTEMLSLKDWGDLEMSGKNVNGLLPHDQVKVTKTFYSHTPLGLRFNNLLEYKQMMAQYNRAKLTKDPVKVAQSKPMTTKVKK